MSEVDMIAALPCWPGSITVAPITGGITNKNYRVTTQGEDFFVRLGADIPIHGVMRFNEHAAARAAAAAGIAPAVVHTGPGVLVTRFVDGKTYAAEDVRQQDQFETIVPLVRRFHTQTQAHLRGPILAFWVFHVVRDYAQTLHADKSRSLSILPGLMEKAEKLEAAVGAVDLVFGHNDLLPANFIDDGEKLWLIDFDYAGFNSPLFDLGGLASNNEISADQEAWMLDRYFEGKGGVSLRARYEAMKCASLLRETLWSMVSEIHSDLDVDYVAYTAENLARFERAFDALQTKKV